MKPFIICVWRLILCREIGINLMGRIVLITYSPKFQRSQYSLLCRVETKKKHTHTARKPNLNIVVTLNVIKLVNNEKHC